MMSVLEYAQDMNKSVEEIINTKINESEEAEVRGDYRGRDDAKWEIQQALKEQNFKTREELVEYVSQKMKEDVIENADKEHESPGMRRI